MAGGASVLSCYFLSRIAKVLPHLIGKGHEPLYYCRMPGGNIVLLANIFIQVEQH
jgi:hypothetical protein